MALEGTIREAFERNEEMKKKLQEHEEELHKANPFPLVIGKGVTFLKFDKKRFQRTIKKLGDPELDRYVTVVNWDLIGSLGDPETWEGTPVNVAVKKGAKDGLAGVLVDMEIIQRILYQRPSGKQ